MIRTECLVHKFINAQAIKILKNDKFFDQYNFFNSYIKPLNEGAVWADQDFKSTNHFYHPYRKKGLYGRKNAMELGIKYYKKALAFWKSGEFDDSLFYLGAALHIIQDMTIPQHANVRLLDNHHQFEVFVLRTYQHVTDFQVEKGAYLLDSIENYIKFNARIAMKVHKRFKRIPDDEERFHKIAGCSLPLAERTTAGAMVMFYDEVLPQTEKFSRFN